MKFRNICLYLLLGFYFTLTSCTEDEVSLEGNWIRQSDFEGDARSGAAVFVINERAYVGTGYDGDERLTDFWSYDVNRNFWQRVTELPDSSFTPRNGAFAFSANGKGYVGGGYDGQDYLKDLWEYDPITNGWSQKSDFIGSARRNATTFSIDNKGYVLLGYDGSDTKDMYMYDPTLDEWTQKVSFTGSKRSGATAFVINGKAYVGFGRNNGIYEEDFWEYDPTTDSWRRLQDMDETSEAIAREFAVGFVIDSRGYVTTGNRNTPMTSTWEYDPTLDEWTEKTAMEGIARLEGIGFVVRNRGFLVTGRNANQRLDDLWELAPFVEENEDD
ncbi:MAG: kelch repeat-containing protein [Bacteroidota bacterium]